VIHELDNVAEVTVFAEKNPILGNIVCARVRLIKQEEIKLFTNRLKTYCKTRLQNFKIPIKVMLVDEIQITDRFKKKRI
jgi:acyl-coenzyme A synthetase/AMP-(fatty) acid ligase